jgi:hypothetical protein
VNITAIWRSLRYMCTGTYICSQGNTNDIHIIKISGVTVHDLVAQATWRPEFVHSGIKYKLLNQNKTLKFVSYLIRNEHNTNMSNVCCRTIGDNKCARNTAKCLHSLTCSRAKQTDRTDRQDVNSYTRGSDTPRHSNS